MNPSIPQQERIAALDIIRGLALIGILFINVKGYIVLTEGMIIPEYTGIDQVIDTLILMFVEKKFFSIFSFLFGVGFYIFASRAESRGDKPLWRFTRRLLMLLLIGILHAFVFWGTILPVYALIGLLLLPFYRAKVTTIRNWLGGIAGVYLLALISKLAMGAAVPLSSVVDFVISDTTLIFIMFLAGFLAAKADWIRRIEELKKRIRLVQLGSLPIFAGLSVWIWTAAQHGTDDLKLIISLSAIPGVLLYVTSLFLLLEHRTAGTILQPFAHVGQMALTNYVAQSLIGSLFISIMGLETVSPVNVVLIACLIMIVQLVYSSLWFRFFKMGPLEKAWRFMTYGKKQIAK
ncbi:hypothetical protein QJ48_15735 [Paenibacillus sp. A3]|uniref:DUF418 domain-containing protein n=1 Tax=Paenibacillus sp. A3 TaxID=1337054 RepID=UPI0006D575EE|nr:DUF418 domain-containing protein [Paenibacillus sp. A3]KPV58596.1 hypothetical protein QJ48_15735 [Paenibacillus sp. A3]